MSDPRHELGQAGESLAAQYLKDKKFKIEKMNYRCPQGEIDIIARYQDKLIFVEVKTRKRSGEFSPLRSVNRTRQKRIIKAAQHYMKNRQQNPVTTPCRFDVIAIYSDPVKLEHIPGAFRPRRGGK